MRKLVLFIAICFSNLIYSQVSEKILLDNFVKGVDSIDNIFVIINMTDLNTKITKEICVINSDLRNAIEKENSITYDESFKLLQKSNSRNFKFKNLDAIELLNSSYISLEDLSNFESKTDIQKIIAKMDKGWMLSPDKMNGKEYQYGYALSKRGFLIGYFLECFGPRGLWCVSCQD